MAYRAYYFLRSLRRLTEAERERLSEREADLLQTIH